MGNDNLNNHSTDEIVEDFRNQINYLKEQVSDQKKNQRLYLILSLFIGIALPILLFFVLQLEVFNNVSTLTSIEVCFGIPMLFASSIFKKIKVCEKDIRYCINEITNLTKSLAGYLGAIEHDNDEMMLASISSLLNTDRNNPEL